MKKLIIFDLDGTLINTLPDLNNSVNYALEQFGFPIQNIEHTRKAIGNGVSKLVERSMPIDKLNKHQECLKIFTEHYTLHYSDNTYPYNGVLETLKALKQQGYLLAVATNKITEVATLLINKFYPNIFDYIQGDEPSIKKKPDSEMVNKICGLLKIDKKDSIYIGDTNVDQDTAINSKIDYILVSYGYRTYEEILSFTKTTKIVNTITDIFKYL